MAKSIDSFGLLAEARKYTNPSVQRALIEIADRLEGYGLVGTESSPGYYDFRFFVEEERLGLMHLDNADPYDGFISIEEYASDLSAINGYITEEELMQELACAGLIVAVDYCEEFKPDGIPLEFIDKGMMKQNGDTYYISSRGRCEYEDWKRRGGVNYYKK